MKALVLASIYGLLIFAAEHSSAADLVMKRGADRLVVTAGGGEPVASYVFADPRVGRPAFRDLAAPGGTVVTRPFPPRKGVDADDHATIHPGAWLCFNDLSGADPWRHKTTVRFVGFDGEPTVVDGAAQFTAKIEYLGTATDTPDATVVCRERSTVSIRDREIDGLSVRILRWEAELMPGWSQPLVFGDVEEMGLGLRVATPLSPARGGRYLASHGGMNEKGIFGRKAYGAKDPQPPTTLEPGKSFRLRYVILLHGDVPDDRLAGLIEQAVTDFGNE